MKKLLSFGLPDEYIQSLCPKDCEIESLEALPNLISTWQRYDALIILCEHDTDTNGNAISRSILSGIAIAQKLRKLDISLPILFVSFLTKEQIVSIQPGALLIHAIGSYFSRLPELEKKTVSEVADKPRLEPMELLDVKLFSCDNAGIIRELIHKVTTAALNDIYESAGRAEVEKFVADTLTHAFRLYNQPSDAAIQNATSPWLIKERDFQSSIPEVVYGVRAQCENLIDRFSKPETNGIEASTKSGKVPWRVLLLDDELNKNSALVTALHDKGVDVVCVSTADKAMLALSTSDRYRRRDIAVIVCDYRLLEPAASGADKRQQQPVQGYQFINNVAKTFRTNFVAAIIYSSLPREFLLETSRRLHMRNEVISKIDYPPTEELALKSVVERIMDAGKNAYEAQLALPLGNSGFKNSTKIKKSKTGTSENDTYGLEIPYREYRRMGDYPDREDYTCREAREWVDAYQLDKAGLASSGASRYLSDATEFTSLRFELKESKEDLDRGGPFARRYDRDRMYAAFWPYYITRRLAMWLWQHFRKLHADPNTRQINEGRALQQFYKEVSTYLIPPTQPGKKERDVSAFLANNLGLAVTTYPYGLTIEELNWLEHDMDIPAISGRGQENFWNRRRHLDLIEKQVAEGVNVIGSIKADIAAKSGCIKVGDIEIHFDDNFRPFLYNRFDVSALISYLVENMDADNAPVIDEIIQVVAAHNDFI